MSNHGLDHDGCSELLAAYVGNELDPSLRPAVEDHLADCIECSAELEAVRSLRADKVPPLTGEERNALRGEVWAQVRRGDPVVVPFEARGRRIGKLLGAAALVILLATGLFYLGTGLGQQAEQFGGVAGTAENDTRSAGSARDDGEEGALHLKQDGAAKENGQAADQGAQQDTTEGRAAPQPTFAFGNGRVDEEALRGVGRSKLFRSFATYDAADAARNRAELTGLLAAQAPDELSAQVRSCARRVYASSRKRALPAYGRTGKLRDRRVLVLGFAYSKAAGAELDRFMFWAWRRGECKPVVDYEEGSIPRRP